MLVTYCIFFELVYPSLLSFNFYLSKSMIQYMLSGNFHPRMIDGLRGITTGGVSVQDFVDATNIDKDNSIKILDSLIDANFGVYENNLYEFAAGTRLDIALSMLNSGFDIHDISESIDWRDFEGFTAEILAANSFDVSKNLFLTKPRMEIDVIGTRLGISLLIDCKHWSHNHVPTHVVQKQIERTRQYVVKTSNHVAAPVIVTLYQDHVNFVNRVPIVPIHQFESFLDEFYGNLDMMYIIERD